MTRMAMVAMSGIGVLLLVGFHDQDAVLETVKSVGRLVKRDTCSGRVHEVVGGEKPEPPLELGVLLHQYTHMFGLTQVCSREYEPSWR